MSVFSKLSIDLTLVIWKSIKKKQERGRYIKGLTRKLKCRKVKGCDIKERCSAWQEKKARKL